MTCVVDDHLYLYGGYYNKNKLNSELMKLFLNYKQKSASWQIVEYEDMTLEEMKVAGTE